MTAPFIPAPQGQNGQQPQQTTMPWQQAPQMQQPQQPYVPPMQVQDHGQHQYFPPPNIPQPQQQQAPQYAPAWQGGGQIPQQQPQYQAPFGQPGVPQQTPQQQQRQQAPAQGVNFDQQGRMFGPGVPQDLQGRTMQEAIQAYGMMRQGYTAAMARSQNGQQQQTQPQQQQGQQQQQNGQRQTSFWQNPEEVIARTVEDRLRPILERSTEDAINQARATVAQQHPQIYRQHEAAIHQRLQGLPPETLANPRAWQLALEQVVGEQALQAQQRPGQQPPIQQINGPYAGVPVQQQRPNPLTQPNQYPAAILPWERAHQQQVPQPNQQFPGFYAEAPSQQAQSGWVDPSQMAQSGYLSPEQAEVARRMGFTPQQYLQGMGARY